MSEPGRHMQPLRRSSLDDRKKNTPFLSRSWSRGSSICIPVWMHAVLSQYIPSTDSTAEPYELVPIRDLGCRHLGWSS
ncbi:hypothetical protein L211DRAFT_450805 [Terfezia boudieri ATCC MYA-4762]|uniref:Uncharacterized protein n=1 Tax=Terfezia boudieri ATCC MYA-4762 TaxID=1051890 RepID=A0A3N4LT45_9PEZI|nr:hypothetical protein L211DRAFT_450805 [Terfezia boudieri ATCC MYA-4762]